MDGGALFLFKMSYLESQQKKNLAAMVPKPNTNDEFIGGGEKRASGPKKVVVRDSPEKWWSFSRTVPPVGSAVLVVDGWNVSVKVSPTVSNPTITINGEEFQGTRKATVSVDPENGVQKIIASVTSGKNGGQQSLIFEAETTVDPKAHSTRYGSTYVYCEYPSALDAAFSQGKVIEELRRLVHAKGTQDVYLIVNDGPFPVANIRYNEFGPKKDGTGSITMVKGSNETEAKVFASHEECHAINEKFEMEKNTAALKMIKDAYGVMAASFKRRTGMDIGRTTIFDVPYVMWPALYSDPLIRLFMEGHYPKTPFVMGHPSEHEWELFASATTILRLFPEQFFDKLAHYERFSAAWPGIADEAKEIARKTVQAWGNARPFDKIVYDKLGLKMP
jgi:hypothetical protein